MITKDKYDQIISLLDEIIAPDFKVSNSGGTITFQESQRDKGKCEKVSISTTQKVFSCTLDVPILTPFNCFNTRIEKFTTRNDGILFCHKDNKLIIFLIELKSNNESKYLKQLKAARNFVEYLVKQINLLSDLHIPFDDIEFRGILFMLGRKTPPKGKTSKKISAIKFENRNDLICTTLSCNQNYKLQQIKEAV